MASHIGRRKFLATLGGAAAAWPLAARAQQPERMRRIGVLTAFAENDAEAQANITAFRQSLEKVGWIGRNLAIDYRWGDADLERMRNYAII
jgi:putative tryptophan/tyrosine transport system substrate-binding protein